MSGGNKKICRRNEDSRTAILMRIYEVLLSYVLRRDADVQVIRIDIESQSKSAVVVWHCMKCPSSATPKCRGESAIGIISSHCYRC